jgi:hypothetical protein
MSERINIRDQVIEIDKQLTKREYLTKKNICNCTYCKNYYLVYKSLPKEVALFLDKLGLDPANPIYVSEILKNRDGSHLYNIYFDLVGKIIDNKKDENKEITTENNPGVKILIWNKGRVPGHLQGEIIEIELRLSLPWVIT